MDPGAPHHPGEGPYPQREHHRSWLRKEKHPDSKLDWAHSPYPQDRVRSLYRHPRSFHCFPGWARGWHPPGQRRPSPPPPSAQRSSRRGGGAVRRQRSPGWSHVRRVPQGKAILLRSVLSALGRSRPIASAVGPPLHLPMRMARDLQQCCGRHFPSPPPEGGMPPPRGPGKPHCPEGSAA